MVTKKKKPAPVLQKVPALDPPPSATPKATPAKTPHSNKGFKWTKKKRRAVKYILRGWSDVRIAKELGIHRMTVKRWKDTGEFRAAVIADAHDYAQRIRFKRVHETGVFADQFAVQLAKNLEELGTQDDGPSQLQLNTLQAFAREFREFREHERADFGDNVRRIEGNFTIGALGSTDPTAIAAGAQSFKTFVEENMDKIPSGLIERARNSGEALVLATRALVQETDIIDQIYGEDVALEEKKGKR